MDELLAWKYRISVEMKKRARMDFFAGLAMQALIQVNGPAEPDKVVRDATEFARRIMARIDEEFPWLIEQISECAVAATDEELEKQELLRAVKDADL